MNKTLINDFTQTSWTGDEIKIGYSQNIDPNTEPWVAKWMKSYDEYLEYYNRYDKRWKTILYNKFEVLKTSLINYYWYYIDPIKYLMNLYYWELLSIKDVYNRVKSMWMDYSDNLGKNWESALYNVFKNIFWWNLRDYSGSEIAIRKRKANWHTDKMRAVNVANVAKKYKLLENYFKGKVHSIISNSGFNLDHFENLPNKIKKILYILKLFYWIGKKEIIEINEQWVWPRVIANFLNKSFKTFFEKNDIVFLVYPKDIDAVKNIK